MCTHTHLYLCTQTHTDTLTLSPLWTSRSGTEDLSSCSEVESTQAEDSSWDCSSAKDLAGREDN